MLKELRAEHSDVELRFWCDKNFAPQAQKIVSEFDATIPVETIMAGKFRRYHHLNAIQHLLWPSLMWANLKDLFKIAGGFSQSIWKLFFWRPDVIFTKGGFVCLPVGIAAKVLRIPLVIHDSDAHPGLTNRVLSRWADRIGTGAPLEYYSYPAEKARYIGIPINTAFRPYSNAEQRAAKKKWGVHPDKPLLVVTGGGLGAGRLNGVVAASLDKLQRYVSVVLVAGTAHYDTLRKTMPADSASFQLHPFITNIDSLLGAADVVATRAGATTILELAALQKPTILVPNAALTGGHQLKNAAVYGDAQVAIVVDEDAMVEEPDILVRAVASYLNDPKTTASMTERFGQFARPHAAKDMAAMILEVVPKSTQGSASR